jgi:hypothetical protein
METVSPLAIVQKDGVGDVARFTDYVWRNDRRVLETVERPVAMVITAPRGQAVIFKSSDSFDRYYGTYLPQSQAVKAFMEQHRND